jgi:hypothetical protein
VPVLTKKQKEVFDDVLNFFSHPERYGNKYVLSGYAGTGKTFLLAEIVKHLPDKIICATTHKARKVLQDKMRAAGISSEVHTIHSILYTSPKDKIDFLLDELQLERSKRRSSKVINKEIHTLKNGIFSNLSFVPVDDWRHTTKNIIVDEASMLSKELVYIALHLNLNMLYVGDGAQLPPVKATAGVNFKRPTKTLSEIVRQKDGSPIPEIAYKIRTCKKNLELIIKKAMADYPEVFSKTKIKGAQNLVWTNKKRSSINSHFWPHKKLLTEAEYIVYKSGNGYIAGEPVIVEKITYHESDAYIATAEVTLPHRLHEKTKKPIRRTVILSTTDLNIQKSSKLKSATAAAIADKKADIILTMPYAITVHKSQGSEYDNVNIYCSGRLRRGTHAERKQWLYTAITRAKNKVYIEF